jgi:hypothetical protein
MHLTGLALKRTIFANCCFAFVLFGYDQGVLAGLVSTPQFLKSFNHPSADLLGTIVAIYDIGFALSVPCPCCSMVTGLADDGVLFSAGYW